MFKSNFGLNEKHLDKSEYLNLWNDENTVAELHQNNNEHKPVFLLHDGPPYANGNLHMGHFTNKVLKDALLKYKRLNGFFAPYVPGFDCHGLPVELEVEKQYKLSKDNAVGFVSACREYANSQVKLQKEEFKTFGVSGDWNNAYLTMNPAFESNTMKTVLELKNKGYMYQKLRPVHWCSACGSSLAEYEVEYKPKTSDSVTVKFPLLGEENTFLLVWTTTPYTLPANKGVAYNPKFQYKKLWNEELQEFHVMLDDSQEQEAFSLNGLFALSPYTKEKVPLLPADYVEQNGTGLVHLAPSFGTDDFYVGETFNLETKAYVDEQGKYLSAFPELEGKGLGEVAKLVLEKLTSEKLLFSHTKLEHEYPHCWRHKSPLFFRTSMEWFMDLTQLKNSAQEQLEQVSFYPSSGKDRMGTMLKGRNSWCVSRNRLWGTPFPFLFDQNGQLHPNNEEVMQPVLDNVSKEGLEAWYKYEAPEGYKKSTQTLDVWFDSGVTHELVVKQKFNQKADLYLEGTDQHRGWFQSSLLTSMALNNEAPYKSVLTHGFVVDEKGKKLSKSSKNYVPLDKLFQEFSPDVLRLWALSQDYTCDLKFSKTNMAQSLEKYKKLRNTLRFCLQNTDDFDFSTRYHYLANTHFEVNKYQLNLLKTTMEQVLHYADKYDLASALNSLYLFAEHTSSFYFDLLKDTLYCDEANSLKRKEAQAVLCVLLEVMLLLLNPLMPYSTEECYQTVKHKYNNGHNSVTTMTLNSVKTFLESNDFTEAFTLLNPLFELRKQLHKFVENNKEYHPELKTSQQYDVVLTATKDSVFLTQELLPQLVDFFGCANLTVQEGEALLLTHQQKTSNTKCERCWQYRQHLNNDCLCPRCSSVEAINDKVYGEKTC